MWRRRGRRVVTPDGYIWFVRRRRARRRPFWSRDRDRGERFHGEQELPDETLPVPGVMDMFTYAEDDLGEPGFDRSHDDRRAARVSVLVITVGVFLVAGLAWLTLTYVLPWLVSLVVDNARPILAVVTTLIVLVALNQLHRPCTWCCSAGAWPTPPGGCGACRDGGGAAACCASSPPPSAKAASTAVAP